MAQQTDEKGQPLTYWGGLADANINELAEEQSEILGWGKYQGLSEQNGFKEAYINGYNKAKETLYTKEQIMDAIRMARQINYLNQDYEIVTSLKLK